MIEISRGKTAYKICIGFQKKPDSSLEAFFVVATLLIPKGNTIVRCGMVPRFRTESAVVIDLAPIHNARSCWNGEAFSIYEIDQLDRMRTNLFSSQQMKTIYKKGICVSAGNLNCDDNVGCVDGIHAFDTRQDAIDYASNSCYAYAALGIATIYGLVIMSQKR